MFDIITIGGATRDFFFEVDGLGLVKKGNKQSESYLQIPYGEKLVSRSAFYSFGGGSVNTSISFSRLGLRATSFCRIGEDGSGRLIKSRLKKEGVGTSLIKEDSYFHTGLSVFVLHKDFEHTGFLERGANNHLAIQKIRPLAKTHWFYVSSLTGDSVGILEKIISISKKNKIKIALNPGSVQLSLGYKGLKEILLSTEILLLNLEEAEKLYRSRHNKKPKDEDDLLFKISRLGPKTVVITKDSRGSVAISDGRIYRQRSYKDTIIDTTGAGDSFGSTFVYGVIKGFDIGYALKIAAINAASVISKMGATDGLLSYNKIKRSKWL